MDLELTKERDLPLLSRKRYSFFTTLKGPTPTRAKIRDAIALNFKSDHELTVVRHIYNRYGVEKAKVIAHVYSKKEDMEKKEENIIIEKQKAKKEEKKEEPAAAPASEETPAAEEPKEDKKD